MLPEALAAIGAARRDNLQTSLYLAIGSALATTGLTIPAVAGVSLWLRLYLVAITSQLGGNLPDWRTA